MPLFCLAAQPRKPSLSPAPGWGGGSPKTTRMEQRRGCSYHRSLGLSSVLSIASLLCRWHLACGAGGKIGLATATIFSGATAGVRYGMICYRTVVAGRLVPRWPVVEVHDLSPRWWFADKALTATTDCLGLWPSENMPCKLPKILLFKSNSSPQAFSQILAVPRTFGSSAGLHTRTRNF